MLKPIPKKYAYYPYVVACTNEYARLAFIPLILIVRTIIIMQHVNLGIADATVQRSRVARFAETSLHALAYVDQLTLALPFRQKIPESLFDQNSRCLSPCLLGRV